MCGIAGFNRAAGKSSIPDGRRFARAAAMAVEDRGRHATGFGWFDANDEAWYWKEQGPAVQVAHRAPLVPKMSTVIAHTRHATLGSPEVWENNHPVVAEGLVLVHNGRCDNHAELFATLGVDRMGEVDSEAIAALLAYGPEQLGAKHPTELLELVRGVAALAWLDTAEPHVLHLARLSTRPLAWAVTRRGDVVFASTLQALRELARLSRVALHNPQTVPEGTYLRVQGGRVTERRSFAVVHPPVPVPADRPNASPRATQAPIVRTSSVRGGVLLDDLDDFDRWLLRRERQADRTGLWDGDDIDWANLVPRRGWK